MFGKILNKYYLILKFKKKEKDVDNTFDNLKIFLTFLLGKTAPSTDHHSEILV